MVDYRKLIEDAKRQQDEMTKYGRAYRKVSYNFPQLCCRCLGHSNAHWYYNIKEEISNHTVEYHGEVPICKKCLIRIKTYRASIIVLMVILFIGGMVGLSRGNAGGWLLGMLSFGIVAFLHFNVKRARDPMKISRDGLGCPQFLNEEYNDLFIAANPKLQQVYKI